MVKAKVFNKAGERAIIRVNGSDGRGHHIYVPQLGTLSNIAGVLLAAYKSNAAQSFGEYAADIVGAMTPLARCRLILETDSPPADFRVVVQFWNIYDRRLDLKVYTRVNGVESEHPAFSGGLSEFAEWATNSTGLEDIVRKIVQFKYNGGSRPGQIRTVRVEKVSRVDGLVHIEGYDLEKEDLKRGFRRYSSDKISGEITLVN